MELITFYLSSGLKVEVYCHDFNIKKDNLSKQIQWTPVEGMTQLMDIDLSEVQAITRKPMDKN